MGAWWIAWWVGCFFIPFVNWPTQTPIASGRLGWAAWGVAAACLSLCEREQVRKISLTAGALVLALIFLLQITVVYPAVVWVDWTRAWETVAGFSTVVCWMIPVLWATHSVLRYSVSPKQVIPPALFCLLCVNLAVYSLFKLGAWSWFTIWQNPGGAFPSVTQWSTYSAICIPILYQWKKWAVIPAVLGLILGMSFCAWVAIGAGALFVLWKRKKTATLTWVLSAFSFALVARLVTFNQPILRNILSARQETWHAVLHAIRTHPFGIGFGLDAYSRVAADYGKAILPHPSSDVLRVIMELGWLMVPLLGWIAWQGMKRIGSDGYSVALVVVAVLACIQNALSIPHIGILAWGIWMTWRINEWDLKNISLPSIETNGLEIEPVEISPLPHRLLSALR